MYNIQTLKTENGEIYQHALWHLDYLNDQNNRDEDDRREFELNLHWLLSLIYQNCVLIEASGEDYDDSMFNCLLDYEFQYVSTESHD